MDLNNERKYYYEYDDKTQLFFVYEHGNDKIIKNVFDKEHKARKFCDVSNNPDKSIEVKKGGIFEAIETYSNSPEPNASLTAEYLEEVLGTFDNKEEYLFTDEQLKGK